MTAPPGQLDPRRLPPSRPPARRGRVLAGWFAAALFTAALAALVVPDLVGLGDRGKMTRVVAFRPWLLVATAALLVGLLVALLRRRSRALVLPFAAGTLAVLVAGGAMVLPRAVADPLPTAGTPLKVLAFNAYEGDADVDALARLVGEQRPDLVALAEAGPDFAGRLAPLVEPLGYRVEATSESRMDVHGVTALVADRLGDVRFRVGDETSNFPYLEATGGALGPLRFVVYHSTAPTPDAGIQWQNDMNIISHWCAGPTPAIVAGDFNATLDHLAFRRGSQGCNDAADQRGQGLVPTWSPTESTELFGPQIDHVLSTEGIEAEAFSVHEIAGSDHHAIVATLRVP
jgi:endonuclease/exonuclease/phosphatase (EEP) superfamily protein YafD